MPTKEMSDCIANCRDCWQRCMETVQHCLTMGGKHAEQQHIALMLTCARMCATSAEAMMLGTAQHAETCRACAALCRACAQDCRRVGAGDDEMQRCAQTCEQCADSCERMAKAA
jgi:hypothetical protein